MTAPRQGQERSGWQRVTAKPVALAAADRALVSDRRDFLRWMASATALAPLAGACRSDPVYEAGPDPVYEAGSTQPENTTGFTWDPGAVPQDDALFPNACLAGEMMPTSVLLAAYFVDRAAKTLRLWRADRPAGTALVVDASVTPDASGYLQVHIDGLEPGTWYQYGYFAGNPSAFSGRSLLAKVRTAIALDALEPITVAISACNGGYHDPASPPAHPFRYPALDVTAQHDYDCFIHLGDQAYMDRVFESGGALGTYLQAWKSYLGSSGMRACYGRAGMYATWDDHEVTDNNSVDPWSANPYDRERIANGIEAFFRVMPIADASPNHRLWRSFRWGRAAEIIILDCRYERRPVWTGQYLSREQMDFFKRRLLESPCHFKIVVNSAPITDMPWYFDLLAYDRWEGYGAARQEVLGHINSHRIENVWFVTGDLHVNFVSRLNPRGSDLASRTREIGVTGGNTAANAVGSQFVYSRAAPRACLLRFDPGANLVHVRFIDPATGQIDFQQDLRQG